MAATAPVRQRGMQMNGQTVKRRAACDECRVKKLKCTGEHPACSRCVRESIFCVYSEQKQMGRPKKRQRTSEDELDLSREHSNDAQQIGGDADILAASNTLEGTGGRGQPTPHVQYDLGGAESMFTSSGDLQPWLIEQTQAWAEDVLRDQDQPEETSRVPELTPDVSSESSPPIHNLPADFFSGSDGVTGNGNPDQRDGSTSLLLDPMLANNPIANSPIGCMPNCACLSTMYLTLSSLQSMHDTFTFPFALHPLREAIKTTAGVIDCEECPRRFITGIQNTQLLGTVVVCIAERFSKILDSISKEATRAELAGETKKFRLADLNTSTSHLHAGGIGCLAAFNLNLSPAEWRSMCKKVVRAEVFGPSDGNDCCAHFTGLTKRIEERQNRWHQSPLPPDVPKDIHGMFVGPPRHLLKKEDHLCMKLVNYANNIMERLDWT